MRRFLSILTLLLLAVSLSAVPAHRRVQQVRQPDGSYVSLQLHGDEWQNFHTTDDGYSVIRNEHGYYVYAQLNGERLEATGHVAHDRADRTPSERQWLEGVRKYQVPAISGRRLEHKIKEQNRRAATLNQRRVAAHNQSHRALYNYNNFRGLVILVEFNDRSFSRSDYKAVIDNMFNQPNYKGYDNSAYGKFTGSVRDYFNDNSMGEFKPQFDIVGPVKVNFSQYDPYQMDSIDVINYNALSKADQKVDFKDYDTDYDGMVDLIYFIYAGIGSNVVGNDERLLWPHASFIVYNDDYVTFDNVTMGDYACSTELYGSESNHILDGIGTICHEFSHVLGLPDLYDTDYEKTGGQSNDPDLWLLMAGGSYENNARTPVGYSLYERYAAGFTVPEVIDSVGRWRLNPLPLFNKGYRINTEVEDEFFLLENRQPNLFKWDAYLPGHGLLVFRVDSSNIAKWALNEVNTNPKHNYFVMIRAGGGKGATASDPFPGSKGVKELDHYTEPANLKTWAGKQAQWGLYNIVEQGNVIRFEVRNPQDPDAIAPPPTTVNDDSSEPIFYNLQGQRVSSTTKGLLIRNGRFFSRK